MGGKLAITADPKICIGAGLCVAEAPDIFGQDDEGTVVLLSDRPDSDHEKAVRSAADLCPSGALQLIEE